MPIVIKATSSTNRCARASSTCPKGAYRGARRMGKCEYFWKYIFCCGWCYGKCCKSERRQGRPAKITRKVEHVEYIKARPKDSKNKEDTSGPSEKNKTEAYYCIVRTNFGTKWSDRQPRPLETSAVDTSKTKYKTFHDIIQEENKTMEYPQYLKDHKNMIGNDLKKIYVLNANSPTRTFGQSYVAPLKQKHSSNVTENTKSNFFSNIFCCLRNKHTRGVTDPTVLASIKDIRTHLSDKKETHETNPVTGNTYDFGCQYSLSSSHSLEITSHVLTKSVSQLSSIESILSLKWRRRFRRCNKRPSALQVMMMSLAKKIKSTNVKFHHKRNKKNNLVVLHVPKKFSNTSTLGTASPDQIKSERVEKALIIKDESSTFFVNNATRPPSSKICGPGEIFVKHICCTLFYHTR